MQQDRSRPEAELSSEKFPTRVKENHLRTSPGSEDVHLARHVCKGSKARVHSVCFVIFLATNKTTTLFIRIFIRTS